MACFVDRSTNAQFSKRMFIIALVTVPVMATFVPFEHLASVDLSALLNMHWTEKIAAPASSVT